MLSAQAVASAAPAPAPAPLKGPLPCEQMGKGGIVSIPGCAVILPDGVYQVLRPALARLSFNGRKLAEIRLRGRHAYVRRDGRALMVHSWDNGPDAFSDGLVRFWRGDKIGYADRQLEVVVRAAFDGAYPFAKGRARACIGCTAVSDGEHGQYTGGQQVCIDPRGASRPLSECGAD